MHDSVLSLSSYSFHVRVRTFDFFRSRFSCGKGGWYDWDWEWDWDLVICFFSFRVSLEVMENGLMIGYCEVCGELKLLATGNFGLMALAWIIFGDDSCKNLLHFLNFRSEMMESIEGEISSLAIRLGEPRECEQRSTSNWTVAITSIHEKGIARVLVRTIIESLVLTVCNKSEFIHRCHNIAGLNISIFYFLFFIFFRLITCSILTSFTCLNPICFEEVAARVKKSGSSFL